MSALYTALCVALAAPLAVGAVAWAAVRIGPAVDRLLNPCDCPVCRPWEHR